TRARAGMWGESRKADASAAATAVQSKPKRRRSLALLVKTRHGGRLLPPAGLEIFRAHRRRKPLDRVPEHRPRHPRGMAIEKAPLGGRVALPHFAQHPADRLVDEVLA